MESARPGRTSCLSSTAGKEPASGTLSVAGSPSETLARQLAGRTRNLRGVLEDALADADTEEWLRRECRDAVCRNDRGRTVFALEMNGRLVPDICAQWLTQRLFLRAVTRGSEERRPEPDWGAGADGPARSGPLARGAHRGSRSCSLRRIDNELEGINDLLSSDSLASALEDLQSRSRPVLPAGHFFERYLAHYASRQRQQLGAFYTPKPLVDYILRSVDAVLRSHWELPDGLATREPRAAGRTLRVVDPASGSGTFLLGLVRHVASRCSPEHWRQLMDAGFAERLVGFELNPISCLSACRLFHWELHRNEGGGPPTSSRGDPHSPVRWANALQQRSLPSSGGSSRVGSPRAVLPIIIGNPPYGNFGRRNRDPWILSLLQDYKHGLDERKLNLDDDFIKFLRWSQFHVEQAGAGVVALVTSNTYLTALTHSRLRRSLLECFDEIRILDLLGDRKRDQRDADAAPDENVFDIQQGVAIGLLVKTGRTSKLNPASQLDSSSRRPALWHSELRGTRRQKLDQLSRRDVTDPHWQPLPLNTPCNFFVPRSTAGAPGYDQWPRLDQIFRQYVSGVQTKADRLLVDGCRGRLHRRIRQLLDGSEHGASREHPAANEAIRRAIREGVAFESWRLRPYQVAPLDFRWVYFDPRLLGRARWNVTRHLQRPNLALIFMRQSTNGGQYDHFLATTELASDRVFYSAHGAPFLAPLFLDEDPGFPGGHGRSCNLRPEFLRRLSSCWKLPLDDSVPGTLRRAFGPLDVFHYAYAVFHSSEYRRRCGEALRIDFPRLPLTTDLDLARQLIDTGRRLVASHVWLSMGESGGAGEWGEAGEWGGTSSGGGASEWGEESGWSESPTWSRSGDTRILSRWLRFEALGGSRSESAGGAEPGRIVINPSCRLEGVFRSTWNYRIGGYPVVQRWLKSRRGQRLRAAERGQLVEIVRSVRSTIDLRRTLDALLDPWPRTWAGWTN